MHHKIRFWLLLLIITCISISCFLKPSIVTAVNDEGGGQYQIVNEPVHEIVFYKLSSYDELAVSGAEYSLTGTALDGTEYNLIASSSVLGKVSFSVKPGSYIIQETKAPDGYSLNSSTYVLTVNEGDSSYTIDGMEKKEIYSKRQYYTLNIPNADGHVTVTKVWDDGTDASSISLNDIDISLHYSVNATTAATHMAIFSSGSGYFGTDTKATNETNQVLYAVDSSNKIADTISGTYADPKRKGYRFISWTADGEWVSQDGNWTSWDGTLTENITLYPVWQKIDYDEYVVQIYGINQDGVNTITFGPALGTVAAWYHNVHAYQNITMMADNFPDFQTAYPGVSFDTAKDDATYHDESAEDSATNCYISQTGITHKPDGSSGCIHNDDWDTIIETIQNDATAYEDCLKYGCTTYVNFAYDNLSNNIAVEDLGQHRSYIKNVPAWNPTNTLNTDLATGATLYTGTNAGGWSASYIRAILNGVDENTTEKSANYNMSSYAAYYHYESGEGANKLTGHEVISRDGSKRSLKPYITLLLEGTPELAGHIKQREIRSIDKLGYADETDDLNSEVDTTYDYLWLFSAGEMVSDTYTALSKYRQNEEMYHVNQSTLGPYQRNINMHIDAKTTVDQGITISNSLINCNGQWTFLRTPTYNSSIYVRSTNASGGIGSGRANRTGHVLAPGFVVG